MKTKVPILRTDPFPFPRCAKSGFTLSEILAAIFLISVPILIGNMAAKSHGMWAGVMAGVFSAIGCLAVVILFFRTLQRQRNRRRNELKEKYKRVYRVLALPNRDTSIKKLQGTDIRIGDYGWEALPLREDSLIYLQGLNPKWRVVWYEGFRHDQIESVALKPQSQYDWNYTWIKHPPPCPFPVQEREITTMGWFPPF
jgi:hypothetical protein